MRHNLEAVELHSEFETTFVWAPGSHTNRVAFRGLNDRTIRDVSRAEIASVIDLHAPTLEAADDFIVVLSRQLGIARLSKDARGYLADCVRWREQESAAHTVTLTWNARYERSKPYLVRRLEALMRVSDSADSAQAERLIAAVRRLPEVGDAGGGLRVENRVGQRPGDSEFIYSLLLSDEGFQLLYHTRMLIGGGQHDYTASRTLVRCTLVGWDEDKDEDEDEGDEDADRLAMMRESAEMMAGRAFDDDEWKQHVEAASESSGVDLPNGIEDWLEMLPVDDDGDVAETVVVQWD